MKRKIKYLTAILLFVFLFYTLKTSYSRFNTQVEGEINNNNTNLQFAGFVVNNTISDSLDFEIKDMVPGEEKTIGFRIENFTPKNSSNKKSDVNIKYKIKLKSYMLPLNYELIYTGNSPAPQSFTCTGFLGKECESNIYQLNYSNTESRPFQIKVTYPSNYKDIIFKNSIDNIHLEIEAWQATS